ncbi:MAG: hypothetical protein RL341_1573 [Pseudomonadota bacterium]
MIIRRGSAPSKQRSDPNFGSMETLGLSEAGAITQYGAHLETLQPGAKSSTRHWHEKEDEFLFALAGEVTVVENDGEHVLQPGDAACWPAGVENAHYVINRSDDPCSYLIVGTKLSHDVCHYPDVGKTLYTEGDTWRVVDAAGTVLKSGHVGPEW